MTYQAEILLRIIEISESKLNHGMTRMMKAREVALSIADKFTYVMEKYLLEPLYLKMVLEPRPSRIIRSD